MAVPNDDAGGLRVLRPRRFSTLAGLSGAPASMSTARAPTQVNVYVYSFWSWTELNYYVDRRR